MKGRNNIGQSGCSRFFMLGMLEVDEPRPLAVQAFLEAEMNETPGAGKGERCGGRLG